MPHQNNWIVAIATAPGLGAVGIIRLSGHDLGPIITCLTHQHPPDPRVAVLRSLYHSNGQKIDQGLIIFFRAPQSYTGEDCLEFHVHGGQGVLSQLLHACLFYGARMARPGEFTERAFLNNKLDLIQAEAVADLIAAEDELSAQAAIRSLSGGFSVRVQEIQTALIQMRSELEGGIDFEELATEYVALSRWSELLNHVEFLLVDMLKNAEQGFLLRSGCRLVLVGPPNVGKSSLLNALSEEDLALVTPLAGTTRDVVRGSVQWQGVPIHLADTAGLRETVDVIEKAGMLRTYRAMEEADLILYVTDGEDNRSLSDFLYPFVLSKLIPHCSVINKSDLLTVIPDNEQDRLYVSAKAGLGLADLKSYVLKRLGWQVQAKPVFLARTRHLLALREALQHIHSAKAQSMVELLAEDLRATQFCLSQLTGDFGVEDLLGAIFSTFCVGK